MCSTFVFPCSGALLACFPFPPLLYQTRTTESAEQHHRIRAVSLRARLRLCPHVASINLPDRPGLDTTHVNYITSDTPEWLSARAFRSNLAVPPPLFLRTADWRC